MSKGLILCVEDDRNLQLMLLQYLEEEGYEVVPAASVAEAKEKIACHSVDVILLDLGLPDGEGIDLIHQVRGQTAAGIIVVSGKDNATERIICLEMGADDYVTKPFELRELTARIKALLRRIEAVPAVTTAAAEDVWLIAGRWRLDGSQYQLFDENDNSAELTTGEFRLLETLVRSPHRALSREHLYDVTRGADYESYDRAIDIQIARLRRKFGDDTKNPAFIKTIRGVGYMFCADVKLLPQTAPA